MVNRRDIIDCLSDVVPVNHSVVRPCGVGVLFAHQRVLKFFVRGPWQLALTSGCFEDQLREGQRRAWGVLVTATEIEDLQHVVGPCRGIDLNRGEIDTGCTGSCLDQPVPSTWPTCVGQFTADDCTDFDWVLLRSCGLILYCGENKAIGIRRSLQLHAHKTLAQTTPRTDHQSTWCSSLQHLRHTKQLGTSVGPRQMVRQNCLLGVC